MSWPSHDSNPSPGGRRPGTLKTVMADPTQPLVSRRGFVQAAGAASWERCHASTNGTLVPASTTKSETVEYPAPWWCTGELSMSALGPDLACSWPSTVRTHGMTLP